MTPTFRISTTTAAIALSLAAWAAPQWAQAQSWQRIDAVTQVIGQAPVTDAGVELGLPLVSEDGSSVPLTIQWRGTLESGVYLKALHIFAPNNPTPQVASFTLSPEAQPLAIETRVRLNESQTVVVVAVASDGQAYVGERAVRITTSGCVAPGAIDPSQEMQARVRAPSTLRAGASGEILTRITHPMHTGLAEDADGTIPEQRIVEQFDATLDGRPLLHAQYYRSLAANPYLRFQISPESGGELVLTWTEDSGRQVEHRESLRVS